MNAPLPLSGFQIARGEPRGELVEGLSTVIDEVAESAPQTHAFLRHQWFAAGIMPGTRVRTLIVRRGSAVTLALPLASVGPSCTRLMRLPGSYWPFRSFPIGRDASTPDLSAAVAVLERHALAVRLGPVSADDPAVGPLVAAARARGWRILSRVAAQTFVLDMVEAAADGPWPRNSTLRKNRFHEKHLAAHGALDWRFVSPDAWPAAFAAMAAVEEASWIASETDGLDAKFTATGHGAFWRSAATDPVLARMFHGAILSIDGTPRAFSFDLDCGATKYAIANSYDPAVAKHSPGKLLYYRNLVEARDRGIRHVDWGAGDSGYKQTLGAVPGPDHLDWLLLRPGTPHLVSAMIARWWQRRGDRHTA